MNKLIMIAAVGKNRELGYKNNLIWRLKEDMMHFKNTTINHHVLMGENTYISLEKPLPNRINMVLSNSGKKYPDDVLVFNSIEEFNNKRKDIKDDIYIIGGASIYKEFIDKCDILLLTNINDTTKFCDVYFPEFNKENYTLEVIKESKDSNPSFSIVKYIKKDK